MGVAAALISAGPTPAWADLPPPDPTVSVQWSEGGTLSATTTRDEPLRLELRARANLGPLRHWWAPGPIEVPAGQTTLVPLELPPEAYLHDEAIRFVTSVRVFARVYRDESMIAELQLPMRYVWWPEGPSGPVEVMDRDELDSVMPGGTVLGIPDEGVHAGGPSIGFTLVEPPITQPAPGPDEPEPEPPPERESHPADDQTDEREVQP